MPVPQNLLDFDIVNSGVVVWLFKKSGGAAGTAPTFTGHWVATSEQVEATLKSAIVDARAAIEEVNAYGLLAQNNEGSVLSIDTLETHAGLIVERVADASVQRKARNVGHIQNTAFYVVRLTNNGQVLHAVRKTDASWGTKRRNGLIDLVFRDEGFELDEAPQFSLSRYVDFFILDDQVFIKDKARFESVLNFRQAQADDFVELQAEPEFIALFTDMAPLLDFVGSNKIQLRRVCAIRQKGHYLDQNFMARLRAHHGQFQLNLNFDANGRMTPSVDNCADIITALLDHRLSSAFSQIVYDVPDATQIH
jgi:hypothetical protein